MRHNVALWAGLAAFFGTILAIGAIDFFNPNEYVQFVGALFVSAVTGGAVYTNQRLADARTERRIEDKKETL